MATWTWNCSEADARGANSSNPRLHRAGTKPEQRWRAAVVALSAGFAACPAAAQNLEAVCAGELITFPLPSFEAFDANEDGVLGRREVAACQTLNGLFAELDLDAGGTLTRPEYASFPALWRQRARSFRDRQDQP